jgi:hypothetical protein
MSKKQVPVQQPIRQICDIAREIRTIWSSVNYAAKPYLEAMLDLNVVTDMYGADSAKSIILYFLSNASTWRGEDAKRIKAELKQMIK